MKIRVIYEKGRNNQQNNKQEKIMSLAISTGMWTLNVAGTNEILKIPNVLANGTLSGGPTLNGQPIKGLYDSVSQRIIFQLISAGAGYNPDMFVGSLSLQNSPNPAGGQMLAGFKYSVIGTAQLMQLPWSALF